MTNKVRIQTNAAPPAVGTYTQAVRAGNLVFTTGQTGREPTTSKYEDGIKAQTRRTFSNIEAILNAAGCSLAGIVQVTMVLADIKDFKVVDQIYAEWLPDDRVACNPARRVFQAAALPHEALIMLDVVATFPS